MVINFKILMNNKMKKLVIFILIMLGVVNFTTLQAQNVEPVKMDNVKINKQFLKYPYMYANVFSDSWAKTDLLQQDYDTFNRLWEYQRKQTREMCVGLGLGVVAISGMIYAVNMPTPVRQVNNPALDDDADIARRNRRIVGGSSIALGAISVIIFAHSFRWTHRIKAEIGLQSLRLQFNLTGKRDYYNKVGSHSKKFKNMRYKW